MGERWSFIINEMSAGCYRCEAIRQTNESISRDGFEPVIAQLLREAFEAELQFGTALNEAAFCITAGYKHSWRHEFLPNAFGSWAVQSYREPRRVIYDGRSMSLKIYRSVEVPEWWGPINELRDKASTYFDELAVL